MAPSIHSLDQRYVTRYPYTVHQMEVFKRASRLGDTDLNNMDSTLGGNPRVLMYIRTMGAPGATCLVCCSPGPPPPSAHCCSLLF